MGPKDADGMANSAVWSGSTTFAQTCLSENFGSFRGKGKVSESIRQHVCGIRKYVLRKKSIIACEYYSPPQAVAERGLWRLVIIWAATWQN